MNIIYTISTVYTTVMTLKCTKEIPIDTVSINKVHQKSIVKNKTLTFRS